jgi:5-methylthioadenosine/S-adenosylhomocysteine deaminase
LTVLTAPVRIVIKNGCVVTGDTADTRYDGADVLIEGNRIAGIGPGVSARVAGESNVEVIDASRSIVMPGLVNAHIHSNEGFEQGAYDNLPLELWLLQSYPPWGMPRFSERQHYLRTMLTAIESIRSGATTVQDDLLHFFCTPEGVDGAVRAYAEAGLRAYVTVTMWNRPLADSLPYAQRDHPARFAGRARRRAAAQCRGLRRSVPPAPSGVARLCRPYRHRARSLRHPALHR